MTKSIKSILSMVIIVFAAFLLVKSCDNEATDNTQEDYNLMNEIGFLNNIPEVSWWKLDNNTVYVAFSTFYDDFEATCNAVAFKGNKLTGWGFHCFAVNANNYSSYYNLSQTSDWEYRYEVTYRYGKIER